MALAVLIGVDAYLRPSELLALTTTSLVLPASETEGSWSLLLHPSSQGARSKVGESDETILLNSRRLAFLTPALKVLYESAPADTPLWPYDYLSFFASSWTGAGLLGSLLCLTA